MSAETPQQPPSEQPTPAPPPQTPPAAPPPPAPPTWQQRTPPPRRSNPWAWGCGLALGGCLLLVVLGVVLVMVVVAAGERSLGTQSGSGEIALIRVEGVITSGNSSASPFGGAGAGSDEIIKLIDRAAADDAIKA